LFEIIVATAVLSIPDFLSNERLTVL